VSSQKELLMSNTSEDKRFIKNSVEAAIQIGVIMMLIYWCFKLAAPFISVTLWGLIIAIGSAPIYEWIKTKFNGKSGLAATVFTLIMLAVLITPSVYFTESIMASSQQLSTALEENTLSIPASPESIADLPLVGEKLDGFWQQAHNDLKGFLERYQEQVKAIAGFLIKAAANLGVGILMFVFSIIIAGVFLAHTKGRQEAVNKLMCRFLGEKGGEVSVLAQQTVQSVVRGILGIAILQAILAGIGFTVIGIPGAGILAIICLILAIVQIDILIILIPLSIYAFSHFGTGAAVAFLIWNLIVGLMNNVLKPILLGRGVKAPMAVVFIGAIGGMLAHGIIGLFVGAVVFVVGYTLFINWVNSDDDEAIAKAD